MKWVLRVIFLKSNLMLLLLLITVIRSAVPYGGTGLNIQRGGSPALFRSETGEHLNTAAFQHVKTWHLEMQYIYISLFHHILKHPVKRFGLLWKWKVSCCYF